MTKSRTAFRAFQERLAHEDNRPLMALGKALFWGFILFNLLMGFMLGTVPLARNIYFHFIFHVQRPVLTWFDEMGWEGQVTQFCIMAALTLAVIYISRNYLALAVRACWMKAVDAKNWFDANVLKKPGNSTNVAPLQPRRQPALKTEAEAPTPPPATSSQRSYLPPSQRDDTSPDTSIVAG